MISLTMPKSGCGVEKVMEEAPHYGMASAKQLVRIKAPLMMR
jgi:hypothetical protein